MKKFFKIGCGGIIALIVLIFIISAIIVIVGNDATDETATSKPKETTTQDETPETEETKIIGIGETLEIKKISFTVNSIEETQQITAGNGMMKYSPDAEGAVYLIANVTVKNDGTEMIQTDSSFFKLIAENGATYSPSTILVADDKFFTFEGINPGLALTGNVVFEMPSGLTGLTLQVQTGFWGTETGKIKLN